jgi:hypothetical protein
MGEKKVAYRIFMKSLQEKLLGRQVLMGVEILK